MKAAGVILAALGAAALAFAPQVAAAQPATASAADLVIVPENPLQNSKTLYGVGHQRLSPDNRIETVGGVKWTVVRGVAYDAKALLADVRAMVDRQRAAGRLPYSGGPGGIGKRDRGPLPQAGLAAFGAWAAGSSR
ncbi:hypothetical protein [Phenylobacterium sp.]|uniref:hypothetical protein n=1 Tax=Phenylobacterium sp. TaxID=1871053 RepID=UPI00391C1AFA